MKNSKDKLSNLQRAEIDLEQKEYDRIKRENFLKDYANQGLIGYIKYKWTK